MTTTKTTNDLLAEACGPLTEIGRSFRPHEAYLAVAMLRAHGIVAQVFDDNSHRMMPEAALALGGMRIMVPVGQAGEAIELLDGVPQSPSRRSPLITVLLIAAVYWSGAPPTLSGLYLRRTERAQPAETV